MRYSNQIAVGLIVWLSFALPVFGDDTDIYLNPSVAAGAEPLVMFTLDYRPNLTAAVCGGTECDSLIAGGYLSATGPYNFINCYAPSSRRCSIPSAVCGSASC